MYIAFLITISLFSLFPVWEKIANFLLQNRKYISIFLYSVAVGIFLILTNDFVTPHKTGEFAIVLLWILLWLPILAKVWNLIIAKRLMIFRKEIWILMGMMAFVHSLQFFLEPYADMFWEIGFWYNDGITYMAIWMIGLIITIILTITSNNYSIKKLWKSWKTLHRIVYALIIITLIHVGMVQLSYSAWDENILLLYLEIFTPFIFYFIWKTLEFRKVRVDSYIKKLIKKDEK